MVKERTPLKNPMRCCFCPADHNSTNPEQVMEGSILPEIPLSILLCRLLASHLALEARNMVLESEEGDEGSSSSRILDFEEVESLKDFSIVINGMSIDSQVSKQDRAKYYNLCRSQNAYLHDHLLEDVNTKQWAATIVSKTVLIADSIKSCHIFTPRSEYESWDKVLSSFEVLGLNVWFLRARLQSLMALASAKVFRRRFETKKGLLEAEERIWRLESEIQATKEVREELVGQMKEQEMNCNKCEDRFKEVVGAEW